MLNDDPDPVVPIVTVPDGVPPETDDVLAELGPVPPDPVVP